MSTIYKACSIVLFLGRIGIRHPPQPKQKNQNIILKKTSPPPLTLIKKNLNSKKRRRKLNLLLTAIFNRSDHTWLWFFFSFITSLQSYKNTGHDWCVWFDRVESRNSMGLRGLNVPIVTLQNVIDFRFERWEIDASKACKWSKNGATWTLRTAGHLIIVGYFRCATHARIKTTIMHRVFRAATKSILRISFRIGCNVRWAWCRRT